MATLEEREIKVEDPTLSPETRRRLTEELREVIGAERVRVPADRPHPSRGEHPPPSRPLTLLWEHRLFLGTTFLAFLTIGAILSLITGNWWLLAVAAGIHAIGTMTVVVLVVQMTTVTEHPSPTAAAMLEEDGVRDPDEYFSELVWEFTDESRVTDVLDDPVRPGMEQRSADTPTGGPSGPGGAKDLPALMNWATILGLVALSIIVPATSGGRWLWLMTAVTVPCAAAWMAMVKLLSDPAFNEKARRHRRQVAVAIIIGAGAVSAVSCALIAVWTTQ
jgi:hypothetical protein